MKTVTPTLIIFVLAMVVPFFTGWWSLPILVGITSYIFRVTVSRATIISFFVVFVAWLVLTYWLNGKFDFPLADAMGELLGGIGALKVHILTALLGGLLGGLGGLCGSLLIPLLHPKK
ncbi:MAG: hypothetical protein R2774_04300 [Saprospiraceae bacterium]